MTSPVTDQVAAPAGDAERRRLRGRLALVAGVAVVLGVLAAIAWRLIVPLPGYTVLPDGSATVTERALTQFFAADAWFVNLGVLVGVSLGIASWLWLKPWGWVSAVGAGLAGAVSGLICWFLGQWLGGAPFDERLAAAHSGDYVPISLELHSPSALAVWAFAAVTPILLGSALGPDETLPRAVGRRRRRRETRTDENEIIDDRGVVTADEPSVEVP